MAHGKTMAWLHAGLGTLALHGMATGESLEVLDQIGDLNGSQVATDDVTPCQIFESSFAIYDIAVIDAWGDCIPDVDCPADVDSDGIVDVNDVLLVISEWGVCL
jgi:hypothetical protein